MNLHEWDTLTVEERTAWLDQQEPKSLLALLTMIGEMLAEADSWDAELAMLIEPNDTVLSARNFTVRTLRDVETQITRTIQKRYNNVSTLLEKAV